MPRLKISDAPLLNSVAGDEKIPTGRYGDYTLTPDMIVTFAQGKLPFATKTELAQVKAQLEQNINTVQTTLSAEISALSVKVDGMSTQILGVSKDLTLHKADVSNPHKVTKAQVGLSDVDNTSDLNKPISTATQVALNQKISSVNGKTGNAVVLTRDDVGVPTDGQIKAFTKEAKYVVDESGLTQQEINSALKLKSIRDMISINNPKNGMVVNVFSYFEGMGVGGGLFIWSNTIDKSKHDGGYVVDPLLTIPALATFNTYYTPKNTGFGVWVRLSGKGTIIPAENFGLMRRTDDPTAVWSCAAIQQAIKKASVGSAQDYAPKTVTIDSGRYLSTNPIILSQNETYPSRIPKLQGGSGQSFTEVEIEKTTNNTVGTGYFGGDIDAVLFVASKTTGAQYVYGEHTSGFTFTRTTIDVGYGYFARNSVMAYRGNIQSIGHSQNFWMNDCWMSELGFIRSYQGLKGIAIRGGTSTFGGPLYVDMAKEHGYDFYGLSYSNLDCGCDGVGASLANGGIAYDLSYCKAVSGTFAVERHKGIEFYLKNTDGGEAKGRSYHSTALPTLSYKVWVQAGSTFSFAGYNWKESLVNLTTTERANYRLSNKIKYQQASSIDYANCEFAPEFARDGFAGQLDTKFSACVLDSAYSDSAGLITHTLSINNTAFKRLCWLGQSSAIELLSANAANPTYGDRFYTNPLTLTDGTPNTISNPKPNRIAKSAISTNQTSPTILWYLSQGGAITASHLRGYVDADGWLCVQHSVSGNNLDYRFTITV